jgi:hypothetical protein
MEREGGSRQRWGDPFMSFGFMENPNWGSQAVWDEIRDLGGVDYRLDA